MSSREPKITKAEIAAGLAAGRSLIQEEWASDKEIEWVDELISEGIAKASHDWEYHDNYQCKRRRIVAND
ncbi:MAG: hypothetical protein JKY32_07725 [Rhizobiales bacterium]|nr:hypothetical protein [Hyphomicrobiales bacterium]